MNAEKVRIMHVVLIRCLLAILFFGVHQAHAVVLCDTALVEAITKNDPDRFAEALARGVNVNCSTLGQFDSNPLSLAVEYKRLEMAKALLSKGAYANAQNRDGITALMKVPGDSFAMMDLLLSYKADANIKTKDGHNVLSGLARSGKFEDCQRLIERGGNPKIVDGNGDTLGQAAWYHLKWVIYDEERVLKFIAFLVKKGLDLNNENENGKTLADLAFSSRHIELVKQADVKHKYASRLADIKPITLEEKLHRAIGRNDADTVRTLLAQGPDLLYPDPLFRSPALVLAVREKSSKIVKLLLDAGSPADIADGYGRTALDSAVAANSDDIIQLLRAANAKPTERTLLNAVQSGNLESVKKLVEKGMDVNARGKENYTALMAAVYGHFPDIVDYLLQQKADPEIKNARGKTAADIAASLPDLELLRKVDKSGAHSDLLAEYTPKKDSPFLGTWSIQRSGSWGDFSILLKNDGTAIFANMLGGAPAVWKDKGTEMELSVFYEKSRVSMTGKLMPRPANSRTAGVTQPAASEKGDQSAEVVLSQEQNDRYLLKVRMEQSEVPSKQRSVQSNAVTAGQTKQNIVTAEQVKQNQASVEDLIRIIETNDTELRKYIQWEKLSPAVLEQLAVKFVKYREPNITLAAQVNCNERTLDILSDAIDSEVKRNVARHKNTSLPVLRKLTERDQDFDVRLTAARNPKMDPKLYRKILEEGSRSLKKEKRRIVARDPLSTFEMQERLAQDVHYDIRMEIARNPATAPSVLGKLATDDDQGLRQAVAYNANTSFEILEKLSRDKEDHVRSAVASSVKTPVSILERLAKDPSSSVQYHVIENDRTPDAILEVFAKGSTNLWDTAKRKLYERERKRRSGETK